MHQMNDLDVATINHIYSATVCKLRIIILHLRNDFICCVICDQVKKTAFT